MSTIGRAATMASDLPAHCGGSSIETSRYLTNRQRASFRDSPSRSVIIVDAGLARVGSLGFHSGSRGFVSSGGGGGHGGSAGGLHGGASYGGGFRGGGGFTGSGHVGGGGGHVR